MNTCISLSARPVCTLTVIALLTGCSANTPLPPPRSGVEPAVGTGFTLPALLAVPPQADSAASAHDLLDATWYATFELAPQRTPEAAAPYATCSAYLERAHEQLAPVDESAAAAFMEIAAMCEATALIAQARPAAHSWIGDAAIDEALPVHLPAEFALRVAESGRIPAGDERRWAEVEPDIEGHRLAADSVRFSHPHGIQEIALVARADFDGDGIEDLLLLSRDYVDAGSYAAFRLFLLTRLENGEPYRTIRLFPRS